MEKWKKEAMPRPFCGSHDLKMKEEYFFDDGLMSRGYQIVCRTCLATGPQKTFPPEGVEYQPISPSKIHDLTVEAWNKAKR